MIDVIAAHRPPLVFISETASTAGEKPLFTGFLVDLLPTLLQTAGIEEAYNIRPFNGSGGSMLLNGSWSGVMGQLTTGQADLALFPLTLTSRRAKYIQHTAAYMDEGYGMLVHVKEVDPGYSFLMPFSSKTWLCFLAAMLAVVLLLTLLDIVTRNARLKAIERTQGIIYSQRTRRRDKLMGHAIETIMMTVGSGAAPTSRSWAVKVMFIAWAIFSVIMLAAYTANLTANLTVNQIGVTIKGLSDLADTTLPFGVPADSSVSALFKNSSDRGAVALRHKMVEYKSTDSGARAVRDKKISAFICDYVVAQYFTQEPPCVLALGTETLGSGSLVMGLGANSTLTDRLNTALLQLGEAGYLSELRRKWFVEASKCADQPDSGTSKNGRLSTSQAWSVFMVLAVGAGVAIVIGVLEVLYYRKLYTGVHKLKKDASIHGTLPTLRKRLTSPRIASRRLSADEEQAADMTVVCSNPSSASHPGCPMKHPSIPHFSQKAPTASTHQGDDSMPCKETNVCSHFCSVHSQLQHPNSDQAVSNGCFNNSTSPCTGLGFAQQDAVVQQQQHVRQQGLAPEDLQALPESLHMRQTRAADAMSNGSAANGAEPSQQQVYQPPA